MTSLKQLLVALVVLIGIPAPAFAQQSEGTIIGDVVDGDTGNNVPGVVVTATSPALQGKLTAVSDDNGRYRLDGLPPGEYTLSFTKDGIVGEPISGIQVRGGVTLRTDAVVYKKDSALANAGTPAEGGAAPVEKDAIRVTATAPIVDVASTQSGGVLNADITRRIPLVAPGAKGGAQRSFEGAAVALPQVQNDTYGASVNGATSVENQYVVDGISVNNTAYGYLGSPLSLEFIEEVAVVTGGYLPEYGRTMGGLLNVVTKSGGNEFHGSVFANAAPGFLEGTRGTLLNAGSAVKLAQKLNYAGDIGFELGGPILADALWFYVGASVNQTSFQLDRKLFKADGAEIPGTTSKFFAEQTGLQGIAKLTWLATENDRVSFSLVATPSTSGGNGKIGIDPASGQPEPLVYDGGNFEGTQDAIGHIYRGGAIDAQVRWNSSLLERRLKLDTSVGWHHEIGARLPGDGSSIGTKGTLADVPRVLYRRSVPGFRSITQFESVPASALCDAPDTTDATECPVTAYNLGGPDFIQEQSFDRYQGRHVSTFLLDFAGLHVMKAGVDLGYASYDNLRAYSGGRRFRENVRGTLWVDNRQFGFLTGPDEATVMESLRWSTGNFFAGAFAQDSWSIADMVTLNLGLRWDGEWLIAGDGSRSISLPTQFSPRAGVIVDPFQTGRMKIYGSYARYFQSVPLDIADRAGSSEPQITSARPQAVCDPSDPAQAHGVCLKDENLVALNDIDQPDQKWIVTGAGRTSIDPNLQPASSDELVLGAEAEIFKDARVSAVYTRRWIGCPFTGAEGVGEGMLCTRAIEDMSRDEANTYFIGNPGFGIAKDFPIAQRNYDALTLAFYKQFSDGWVAQAAYTLSFLYGNYAGLFRPETGQLDPFINSDFDLKSLTVNRTGFLPGDKNHQVKLFGAKEFETAYDTKFTLGGAASASSGTPTNYLGSHPLYGSDEVFVLPRGSGKRLDWVFNADVHGGFTVEPWKGQQIELTVDVFNLFNFQTATLVDESYTSADVNPLINCDGKNELSCTDKDLSKLKQSDNTDFDSASLNPNFGQPIEYQAPRTVRFGLRWSF